MLRNSDLALFFHADKVLAKKRENPFLIPMNEVYADPAAALDKKDYFYLGEFEGKNIFAAAMNLPNAALQESFSLVPARDALKISDSQTSQLLCRAKQLLHWHQSSLFSGCCGAPTTLSEVEIAKVCQCCNKVIYPNTFPCVIVLVEKGRNILLARSPHFAPGMYSTLAGFMEAGESCEAAIHREIEEEVGIEVKDISYFGSQSWPFPSSLMLGFRAKYASGQIRIDNMEIEDAKWFDVAQLPSLPHECSIARHMIDRHITQFK